VTIETIHGAKGLEFPVVILANLFREVRKETEKDIYVARNWTSGMIAPGWTLRNHAARAYTSPGSVSGKLRSPACCMSL